MSDAAALDAADAKAERDRKNDEELEAAKAEDKARHEKREAEIEASWQKKVLVKGTGREAYRGAQARVHVVGRAIVDRHVQGRAREKGFVSGSVFEDSRERGVPLLLLLGRGTLVPGLDRALLAMCVGERAEVTVAPEGGYGAAGSVEHPCVPGSATLRYDVEMLAVEKEEELWDMSFARKMALATERRQRGNTLVGGGHLLMADAEYEQALRYLVFMPHPEPPEVPVIGEALAAVHLNLAATRLRLAERGAIRHARDALQAAEPLRDMPKQSKAHYRLGQAHTQLGAYSDAESHFEKAEACAAGDAPAQAAIRKERLRLAARKQKHARDRKKAAERMVNSGGADADADVATARGGWWRRRWRAMRSMEVTPAGQTALFTLGATALVALLAAVAQLALVTLHAARALVA